MENKNVLIVGAAGGMGQPVCRIFVENGFNVFGIDIKDKCDIENITYIKTDITKENDVEKAFNLIRNKVDSLYAIITVVGIYVMDSLLEISDKEIKKVLDTNVLGIQRVVKTFFPLLKNDSRIFITTSELATLDPLPFNGIYSMSKSLLEKYAFSLRMEINNFGIKVITYRPGAVKTDLLSDSTLALSDFCYKTQIHQNSSRNFKHIVDKVESKAISAEDNAKFILKIVTKNKPLFAYSRNRNIGLFLLNLLPDFLQVKIISKILK